MVLFKAYKDTGNIFCKMSPPYFFIDYRWYFPDTKRVDAEKMLLSEGNKHGAFLIRQCESQRGELSLSGKFPHSMLWVFYILNWVFAKLIQVSWLFTPLASMTHRRFILHCMNINKEISWHVP